MQFAKEMGGEPVHQWLCADAKMLESQALPAEIQKVQVHVTEQLNLL